MFMFPKRNESIQSMVTPTNTKAMQRFLGSAKASSLITQTSPPLLKDSINAPADRSIRSVGAH